MIHTSVKLYAWNLALSHSLLLRQWRKYPASVRVPHALTWNRLAMTSPLCFSDMLALITHHDASTHTQMRAHTHTHTNACSHTCTHNCWRLTHMRNIALTQRWTVWPTSTPYFLPRPPPRPAPPYPPHLLCPAHSPRFLLPDLFWMHRGVKNRWQHAQDGS